jgi:hypothetical protein
VAHCAAGAILLEHWSQFADQECGAVRAQRLPVVAQRQLVERDPMSEVHVLVDLENNQPTLTELQTLVPGLTHAWLFHNESLSKHLESYAPLGDRQTAVPIAKKGTNSLDFHLAFYLGYIASRKPNAKLVVVAIDGGYSPMILHAKELGFDVDKVPFTRNAKLVAKSTPIKKAAAKTKGPPVKKVVAKARTTAPAKKVTSVKKVAAAKKVPKVPLAAAKLPSARDHVNRVKIAAKPDSMLHGLVVKAIGALRKMGDKRPKKLKTLERHLASLLGAGATESAVRGLLADLRASGAVGLIGDAVKYHTLVTHAD